MRVSHPIRPSTSPSLAKTLPTSSNLPSSAPSLSSCAPAFTPNIATPPKVHSLPPLPRAISRGRLRAPSRHARGLDRPHGAGNRLPHYRGGPARLRPHPGRHLRLPVPRGSDARAEGCCPVRTGAAQLLACAAEPRGRNPRNAHRAQARALGPEGPSSSRWGRARRAPLSARARSAQGKPRARARARCAAG